MVWGTFFRDEVPRSARLSAEGGVQSLNGQCPNAFCAIFGGASLTIITLLAPFYLKGLYLTQPHQGTWIVDTIPSKLIHPTYGATSVFYVLLFSICCLLFFYSPPACNLTLNLNVSTFKTIFIPMTEFLHVTEFFSTGTACGVCHK